MSLVKYTLPGDESTTYSSSTAPYGQSATDGSSSSPAIAVPVYPLSTPSPTYYADPIATTSSTSYTPYPTSTSPPTVYGFTGADSSPPSTTQSGPAAVSETSTSLFRISNSDGYLSTSLSLSSFLTSSTAPAQTSNISSTNRTALIAALTAGLSALLLLLLLAFLLYRRRRRRREQRLEPPIDSRALPDSALLHDDEMAHQTHLRPPPVTMTQYENSASGGAVAAIYRPASPSPSILRTRISESGSIFREEVWPPPSPTIDPIQMRSSQVDLSRIVDDVMGPAHDQNTGDPISDSRKGHKRELTANSTTPLLFEGLSSLGHGSSEEDLTHVYTYSPLYSPTSPISPPVVDIDQTDVWPHTPVPEAYAPVMQKSTSQSSYTSVASSIYSRPGPAGSSNTIQSPCSFRPSSRGSLQGSIASSTTHQRTQPKVSSPLVRALTGFGVGNGR